MPLPRQARHNILWFTFWQSIRSQKPGQQVKSTLAGFWRYDVAKNIIQYIVCVCFYVSTNARHTPNHMPIFSKLRCHLDLPGSTLSETAIKPQEYCAKPKTFCAITRCFYGDSALVLRAIYTCCALTPGIFAEGEARWRFHRRGS